jgi:hypothetical protein
MSATASAPVANIESVPVVKSVGKPDFGSGRYSAVMAEAHTDCLRLVTKESARAEKFARQLGADLGRAMAASPVAVKYGKANKDGRMTLKEAASVKGIAVTNSMSLARLLAMANDINGTKLARVDSLTLAGTVAEWFNGL